MSLLHMSISGAIMILMVIVVRALAISRLPKKTFIALWGIVLLRLLVLFSFPSPFSAYSLINQHIFAPQETVGLENANVLPPTFGLPTPWRCYYTEANGSKRFILCDYLGNRFDSLCIIFRCLLLQVPQRVSRISARK